MKYVSYCLGEENMSMQEITPQENGAALSLQSTCSLSL